jgi:serine/threonine protein kinase
VTPLTQRTGICDKHPGAEPLPGYRLLTPLGRGGFGEVWKCEAPGGLHKAIKFVPSGGEQFRQEIAAFIQMKAIRHPYLLTLERVELTDGELVMVMELADCQLNDRFRACRAAGLIGIPRAELLGYLGEAAEALDMMSRRYSLQHLDVKPENLFLVADHLKVGDYGLVRRTERSKPGEDSERGFTPRYAAPEVLRGRVDTRSDQYSLALVYVELLTGTFPYVGPTAQQMILQHLDGRPDLSALPLPEQSVVGQALEKNPSGRFPTCSLFIKSLVEIDQDYEVTARPSRDRENRFPTGDGGTVTSAAALPTHATVKNHSQQSLGQDPTQSSLANRNTRPLRLITATPRSGIHPPPLRQVSSLDHTPPPPPRQDGRPVISLDQLHGMPAGMAREASLTPVEFIEAIVSLAARGDTQTSEPGSCHEGLPVCRFLSSVPVALIPLKLAIVAERWGLALDQTNSNRLTLRWEIKPEPKKSSWGEPRTTPPRPRQGFEVVVDYPKPPQAEFAASGKTFGPRDPEVSRKAIQDIPAILEHIRSVLQTIHEKRSHPRYLSDFSIRVYPFYPDGEVSEPLSGRCRDVSLGGVRFVTPAPVRTSKMFLEFPEVEAVSGHAILATIVRHTTEANGEGSVTMGRFLIER